MASPYHIDQNLQALYFLKKCFIQKKKNLTICTLIYLKVKQLFSFSYSKKQARPGSVLGIQEWE